MMNNPRAKRKDEWLESMVSDGYVTISISCAHECEPAIGVCIEGTYNYRIIYSLTGLCRYSLPIVKWGEYGEKTLPGREFEYFAQSTAVLRRKYSSTLGAVLEYFHRSTGVFLLEYSSIPTEVLWRPSILLPLLPFPVWKAGDGFIPCTMEYFHLNAYKVITVR